MSDRHGLTSILEFTLKRLNFFLIALLISGCSAVPNIWGSSLPPVPSPTFAADPLPLAPVESAAVVTAPAEDTPTPTETPTLEPTFTASPTATITLTPTPSKADIEQVIIISYDGLRPDAIDQAPMPNVMFLRDNGAHAPLTARTIDYPATSPSHASMLTGMCMENHTVIYNKFFMYMGYAKGPDVFELAHNAGMKTVMVVSKDKLRQMAEPETTDVFEVAYGEPAIQRAVLPQLETDFDLMFIHFAGGDNRGHKYGWMSGEYMKVLREGDAVLGEIINTLKANGKFDNTLFIITADHGGHDRNHIGLLIEDYRITWITYGPGVIPQELDFQIYTFDTAPTIAYALGLPMQEIWDGLPVLQIFGEPQPLKHEKYPCKT